MCQKTERNYNLKAISQSTAPENAWYTAIYVQVGLKVKKPSWSLIEVVLQVKSGHRGHF